VIHSGRQAPFLLANIRLGWKSLLGTNTLAYWVHSYGTKKSVLNTAPDFFNGVEVLIKNCLVWNIDENFFFIKGIFFKIQISEVKSSLLETTPVVSIAKLYYFINCAITKTLACVYLASLLWVR